MRTVYICSPYSGDTKRNKQYARELTALAIANGCAPITPHLYITECLNDGVQEQRNKGLSVAIRLLQCCDMIYVGTEIRYFGRDGIRDILGAKKWTQGNRMLTDGADCGIILLWLGYVQDKLINDII